MTQNYNLNNHIEIWTLSLKLSILFLLIKVASYNPSIIFRNKKEKFQAFYKCSIFTPWLLTCSRCYVSFNFLRFRVFYHTALLVDVVTTWACAPVSIRYTLEMQQPNNHLSTIQMCMFFILGFLIRVLRCLAFLIFWFLLYFLLWRGTMNCSEALLKILSPFVG